VLQKKVESTEYDFFSTYGHQDGYSSGIFPLFEVGLPLKETKLQKEREKISGVLSQNKTQRSEGYALAKIPRLPK